MHAVLNDDLSRDNCRVVALAFDNETSAAMRKVVHVLGVTGIQVFVINHINVRMPSFPQFAALLQSNDLCRLAGDAVNRLGRL